MSIPEFKKAKAFEGKDLTLYVGGGDRKIRDGEILRGAEFARFAGMGFLSEVKPTEAEANAEAEAEPEDAEAGSEGSMTKSSAGKLAAAHKKGKGKKGEAKEEDESSAE